MSRYTSTDFWRLYGQLVYIKSVEWLKKNLGKGSIHSPRLVDPKKGYHFMSGLRNAPPPPSSVQTFAKLSETFPFSWPDTNIIIPIHFNRFLKVVWPTGLVLKKTKLKTMFYFFSVTSSNCWRGTCTPDTWWGLWGWCGSRWRCSRGGSSYTDCSTGLRVCNNL